MHDGRFNKLQQVINHYTKNINTTATHLSPELKTPIENVKLLGENHFMASAISMDINLAADSKTNVDIQSYRGDIQLSGHYKDLKKVSENIGTRVSHTEKDATGKIIILNSYGNISMK